MSQTEPQPSSTHRFANEPDNPWCKHCGLSEAAHDLQSDQPSNEPAFVRGDTITVCPELMELDKDYAVLFAGQVYIYRKTSESEVIVYVQVG